MVSDNKNSNVGKGAIKIFEAVALIDNIPTATESTESMVNAWNHLKVKREKLSREEFDDYTFDIVNKLRMLGQKCSDLFDEIHEERKRINALYCDECSKELASNPKDSTEQSTGTCLECLDKITIEAEENENNDDETQLMEKEI